MISGEYAVTHGTAGDVATIFAEEPTAPYKIAMYPAIKGDSIDGANFNYDDPDLGPIFQKPEFRQAFSMIIDRETLAEKVYPHVAPAYSIIWHRSPPLTEAVADIEARTMLPKFDREKGLRMFDEMGIKDTDGDGWREFPPGHPKAGQPFGWYFLVEDGDPSRIRQAEEIKYQLEPLGFKIGMRIGEESVIQGEFSAGKFHMYQDWLRGVGTLHKSLEDIMNRSVQARFLPVALDERMPYYRQLSGADASKYLPWEKEALAVFDDYEAGKLDLKTAARKVVELMAMNMPNIPTLTKVPFEIYSKTMKNNPLEYSPHMQIRGSRLPWSSRFMLIRIYEWFEGK
jgi:ABC-type transport system substrate-binding protein